MTFADPPLNKSDFLLVLELHLLLSWFQNMNIFNLFARIPHLHLLELSDFMFLLFSSSLVNFKSIKLCCRNHFSQTSIQFPVFSKSLSMSTPIICTNLWHEIWFSNNIANHFWSAMFKTHTEEEKICNRSSVNQTNQLFRLNGLFH